MTYSASDSDSDLKRMRTGDDVSDAVLSTELRLLKAEVWNLRSMMADIGSLRVEMREYVARQDARYAAWREAAEIERQNQRDERKRFEQRLSRMSEKTESIENRVVVLEGFKAKILGAIAVAGAAGGVVGVLAQLLLT